MSARALFTLCFALGLALPLAGCSPSIRFGDKARYAPDYGGYVIGDPDHKNSLAGEVIVLRDPLTRRKIRCREELDRWLLPSTRSLSDFSRDDNLAAGAVLLMTPVSSLAMPVAMTGAGLVSVASLPALIAAPRSTGGLVEDAERALQRRDYATSASTLERALARDDSPDGPLDLPGESVIRRHSKALYFLGLSYAALGRSREAAVAFGEFVETASVRDEPAYTLSEKQLASLGAPSHPRCASRAEVPIRWSPPR